MLLQEGMDGLVNIIPDSPGACFMSDLLKVGLLVYCAVLLNIFRPEGLQRVWKMLCGPTSLTTLQTGKLTLRRQVQRFGNKQVDKSELH